MLKTLSLRRWRQEAERLAKKRQWPEAAKAYSKVVKAGGGRAAVRIRHAFALEQAGDPDGATLAYLAACQRFPAAPNTHRQLGLHLLRRSDRAQARKAFVRAAVLAPDDEVIAKDLRREGVDLDAVAQEALTAFLPLGQSSEFTGSAWSILMAQRVRRGAKLAAGKGRWAEALAAYRKLVQMPGAQPQHFVQLGHALKMLDQHGPAETAYWRALSLMPRDPDLYVQLGHMFKLRDNPEGAAHAYLIAWKLQPGLANAELELTGLGWSRPRLAEIARTAWSLDALESGGTSSLVQQFESALPVAGMGTPIHAPDTLSPHERVIWSDFAHAISTR